MPKVTKRERAELAWSLACLTPRRASPRRGCSTPSTRCSHWLSCVSPSVLTLWSSFMELSSLRSRELLLIIRRGACLLPPVFSLRFSGPVLLPLLEETSSPWWQESLGEQLEKICSGAGRRQVEEWHFGQRATDLTRVKEYSSKSGVGSQKISNLGF